MTHGLSRRGMLRTGAATVATTSLLAAGAALARPRRAPSSAGLLDDVRQAAGAAGVPVELLLAIGYTNTRLEMPGPGAADYRFGDPEGRGSYGVMALVRNPWEDTVGLAAELTGLSVDALVADRAANLRGGAAVLAHSQGGARSSRPGRPAGWLPAVAGHGGRGPTVRASAGVGSGELYAEQVGDVLAGGFDHRTLSRERVRLAPQGRRA